MDSHPWSTVVGGYEFDELRGFDACRFLIFFNLDMLRGSNLVSPCLCFYGSSDLVDTETLSCFTILIGLRNFLCWWWLWQFLWLMEAICHSQKNLLNFLKLFWLVRSSINIICIIFMTCDVPNGCPK